MHCWSFHLTTMKFSKELPLCTTNSFINTIQVCCDQKSITLNSFLLSLAHRCSKQGCGLVLILDGNLKNSRDVCAAEDAGFVEYAGLPGQVKTGCMETPQQSGKFCLHHQPRKVDSFGQQKVVEMVLSKRET